MEIKATKILAKNLAAFNSDKDYIINVGGSRSSKTYSICQLLIIKALEKPRTINVFRKARATHKSTTIKTMKTVLFEFSKAGIKFNQTDNYHNIQIFIDNDNYSEINFFGCDDEQKLRGLESDIVWINEANELYEDDAKQIFLRLKEKAFLDFNPSFQNSWIDKLDAVIIHSTYKDNPFITQRQIKEIESYKESDPDFYQIFGLGLKAQSKENVYSRWKTAKELPEELKESFDILYGLDFGYTHPLCLVKIYYKKGCNTIYIEELIYKSGLDPNQMIDEFNKLVEEGKLDKSKYIIADSARPELINMLCTKKFKTLQANKSVLDGILSVKKFNIYVNELSTNTLKENELYRWKKVNGQILDEVVKENDDAMDAIRYPIHWLNKNFLI